MIGFDPEDPDSSEPNPPENPKNEAPKKLESLAERMERILRNPPTPPLALQRNLSNGSLTPEDQTELESKGFKIESKSSPGIWLSAGRREHFDSGRIRNLRPTEAGGYAAVVFHYCETDSWETVELKLTEKASTKETAWLIGQAIKSSRVPFILVGVIRRKLSEESYEDYPDYDKIPTKDWAKMEAEGVQDKKKIKDLQKSDKQKDSRINHLENENVALSEQLHEARITIEILYKRDKAKDWKWALIGFGSGFVLCAALCAALWAITLYTKHML
ncbi:MAG: hypothetical protein PHD76_00560 [Methylacidiphilales bacterium]|nr:hypothetical protein [Candidatus Methylacidiphilales bacterium]